MIHFWFTISEWPISRGKDVAWKSSWWYSQGYTQRSRIDKWYGGFLKWGYPQFSSTEIDGFFHNKNHPAIGVPPFRKHPGAVNMGLIPGQTPENPGENLRFRPWQSRPPSESRNIRWRASHLAHCQWDAKNPLESPMNPPWDLLSTLWLWLT